MQSVEKYGLAVNSMIIVVLTGILTIILHELGHFVPAYFYGLQPELHHNFVFYDDNKVAPFERALIAAAGPVLSLILGVIFLFTSKQINNKGYLSLFMLWMGLQGFLSFFGYLFVAPFFTYGDTGKVFEIMGLPVWAVVIISIFGIGALTFLYNLQAKEFRFYGSEDMTNGQRANALIFFPVLASIAACVLHFPVPTFLSLLAPMMMPMSFMNIYGTFRGKVKEKPIVPLDKISWVLVIALIAAIIVFRMLVYPVKA